MYGLYSAKLVRIAKGWTCTSYWGIIYLFYSNMHLNLYYIKYYTICQFIGKKSLVKGRFISLCVTISVLCI